MKSLHIFLFILLIATLTVFETGLSLYLHHVPVSACAEIRDDGTMITYTPVKGYCSDTR